MPGLILEAPPGVLKTEEAARKFLSDWASYHSGLDNAAKTALLRDGIQAKPMQMNGRDAQWIEQRKFQRQEAALWMLLESILGDDASVSYNSLEQKNMAYLTNCLMRWLVKWEEELNEKLLTGQQKRSDSHYFKFNVSALLRGTTVERYQVYQIARQIGVLSANDVRDLEDMDEREDGDSYDNPAITPGQPSTEPPATKTKPTENPDDTSSGSTRERLLVASRLREIVSVEANRVSRAAAKEKNFLVWLDGFYSDSNFGGRLASVYESVGASRQLATEHIEESKDMLLGLAGSCGADVFAHTVDEETATWHERADEMAEIIVNATTEVIP